LKGGIRMKKLSLGVLLSVLLLALVCTAFAGEEIITYSSRGVQIPATVVTPDESESFPMVVLAHGHGGSREENVGFAAIAAALQEQGIGSIRMDFPGCGDSTESFQMNTLTNMEADVQAAIEYVKATYPVESIGLFGYSMGGRIVLDLVAAGVEADGIALLAPAADVENLKNLFGGPEAWDTMKATANKDGFVVYTTIYGQVQELSAAWFSDLESNMNVAPTAADLYNGSALVIWGSDDEAVSPEVSAQVADLLDAQIVDATGEGHGYGFYSEDDTVRSTVANAVAAFFLDVFQPAYEEADILLDAGDHLIPATVTLPLGDGNFPAVIMLHGNGSTRHEAGNAYDYAAPAMAVSGIATIRFDYLGNGDSEGDYIDYTYDQAIADAMVCYAYLEQLGCIDMSRVGIMGWSQGGRVALLTASRNDVFKSVCTWAGAYGQKEDLSAEYEIAKRDGFYLVEYDWREPLKQGPAYYECAMAIDYPAAVAAIKAPILAINGTNDTTVLPETAQAIIEAATNPESRVLLMDGASHTFEVFSGDTTVLENLVMETINWFATTL